MFDREPSVCCFCTVQPDTELLRYSTELYGCTALYRCPPHRETYFWLIFFHHPTPLIGWSLWCRLVITYGSLIFGRLFKRNCVQYAGRSFCEGTTMPNFCSRSGSLIYNINSTPKNQSAICSFARSERVGRRILGYIFRVSAMDFGRLTMYSKQEYNTLQPCLRKFN